MVVSLIASSEPLMKVIRPLVSLFGSRCRKMAISIKTVIPAGTQCVMKLITMRVKPNCAMIISATDRRERLLSGLMRKVTSSSCQPMVTGFLPFMMNSLTFYAPKSGAMKLSASLNRVCAIYPFLVPHLTGVFRFLATRNTSCMCGLMH